MKQEFQTKLIDTQPVLSIRATATMDKIGEVMGPLFGEVYGCIQQSGQEPAGMPFAIYHSMDGDMVDFECGIPTVSPMESVGRAQAGGLPGGTVATVTHMGPYDALRQTWAALTEWMSSRRASSPRARPGKSTSPTPAGSRTNRSGAPTSSSPCADRDRGSQVDGHASSRHPHPSSPKSLK